VDSHYIGQQVSGRVFLDYVEQFIAVYIVVPGHITQLDRCVTTDGDHPSTEGHSIVGTLFRDKHFRLTPQFVIQSGISHERVLLQIVILGDDGEIRGSDILQSIQFRIMKGIAQAGYEATLVETGEDEPEEKRADQEGSLSGRATSATIAVLLQWVT